jgi:uncharacterized membrane protein
VTPLRPGAAVTALLLFTAGCADRGLASGPTSSPGAGTWTVVGSAATAAALVAAALVVLPAWRAGGAAFAAGLLAAQAGGVLVGGAVLLGAAVRSEQLITRPADTEQAASLLRLTGLDGGDAGFFRVLAVLTAVLGSLLLVVLVMAARFAADRDHLERMLAAAVLAFEAAASGAAVVLVALGHRSLPFVAGAAALPVLAVAAATCWPRARAEGPSVRYNERHG